MAFRRLCPPYPVGQQQMIQRAVDGIEEYSAWKKPGDQRVLGLSNFISAVVY
jgi:hypothetical protein